MHARQKLAQYFQPIFILHNVQAERVLAHAGADLLRYMSLSKANWSKRIIRNVFTCTSQLAQLAPAQQ